ncbi:glycerol-3-phosphate transporter 5 [Canna indica]|uniref:Glycerol-3-phosphate transporter 5 n=1 Tax=Canna indica TaxID=4628 RepID=A0AAQ3JL40_9LILI|nr:glycerol-3-phosphate transporter 5 [Canna indica]
MEAPTDTLPPKRPRRLLFYQISVLLLTFSAYAAFHASRKPPSIVKSVLGAEEPSSSSGGGGGWPPFDGPRGPHRLGELDLAFLSSYSAGMYLAGHVADRVDLRRFLALGMLASGASTAAFGAAYWLGVHSLSFFVVVQIASGIVQSIGWPCVIAVIGNWFGKSPRRGLIMGVWNSNTSIGNILGSIIASSVLEFGWGWSFLLPGVLICVVGFFVWAFLVPDPENLGFEYVAMEVELNVPGVDVAVELDQANGERTGLLGSKATTEVDSTMAIGFLEAWKLPGVAPFAFCLFFSKLVAYTFLYWLPFYIRHTDVAGKHVSHKTAGILSTIFDIGGVLGGVSAGFLSDRLDARASTSILFLFFSIPALIAYRSYGSISMQLNIGLMFLSGYFVNGPYSLITTAVSAELGTQGMMRGNSRALATVTAIIDGTGSVGAALGPLLTGYISTRGWNSVFLMLICSTSFAITFLIHLAKAEVRNKMSERKSTSTLTNTI